MQFDRTVRSWCLVLVLALSGAVACAQSSDAAAGTWQGAIDTPPPLEVTVHLAVDDGAWTGLIDIPAQGAANLPLTDVIVIDGAVRFVIANVQGEPTFEGTVDGAHMEGTFTQGGQSFAFELERVDPGASLADAPDDPAPAEVPAAPGPDAAAPVPEEVYEDPDGLFSVPVPDGWTLDEREDHVRLTGPDGGIRLSLLTLESDDLEAAIHEAWTRVDPEFDAPVDQVLEPPSQPGVERTVQIEYDTEPGAVRQAIAQLHDGLAHVLLVDAELEAAQRLAAQIDMIVTGYAITALEDVDRSGVEPRSIEAFVATFEAFVGEAME